MFPFIPDPDLQLDDFQKVIAKYTIRHAIEKLTLLSIDKKKNAAEVSAQKRKQHPSLAPEFDVSNNIDRIKSNLIEICRQIEYDGSFEVLEGYIMENEKQESIDRDLLRKYAANKSTVKYYDHQLSIDLEALKSAEMEMRSQDYMLGEMNLQTVNQNQIEYRYNNAWEATRLDQLKCAIENEEHENYFEFDRYKMLLNREEEAVKNLVDCYQTKIKILEDNMEYWTGEYERQMENIGTDIHLTKDWITELEKKLAGQERVYTDYQQIIEAFFARRRLTHCARKIQRWWREILEQKEIQNALLASPKRKGPPQDAKKKK